MTSSQGSPAYFLSWLAAPIDLNWKMRLSRPMVVWPSMTAWGPTVVPAQMRTCGPMTVYGPTLTELSIWAAGSTMAVGWIAIVRSLDRAHGAHQLAFAGDLLADARDALELVDAGLVAPPLDVHHELVARLHDALEAGPIDAGEVVHRLVVGRDLLGGEGQQRGRLGHGLQ